VDLSPTLIELARERLPEDLARAHRVRVGDMLGPGEPGEFDHVVAMDSLIHYDVATAPRAGASLAGPRVRASMLFTFAPRTPLLEACTPSGKLFPRSDRAPAIVPVSSANAPAVSIGESLGWRLAGGRAAPASAAASTPRRPGAARP
jgi:magnesium-protoporphyrin O-methyltransferase